MIGKLPNVHPPKIATIGVNFQNNTRFSSAHCAAGENLKLLKPFYGYFMFQKIITFNMFSCFSLQNVEACDLEIPIFFHNYRIPFNEIDRERYAMHLVYMKITPRAFGSV